MEMPEESTQRQSSVRVVGNLKQRSAPQPAVEMMERADPVGLSERAQELARAQQAVDAAPDVRSDKVAELKKRIEEGAYDVPAELLADKMLETSSGQ